jgi:hypothetical protein
MVDIFNDFTTEDLETLRGLLEKLNGGKSGEQVGFEEDVNYKFETQEGFQEAQLRALDYFISKRNGSNNKN